MTARAKNNIQRKLNQMLEHGLIVQLTALSFAGLALAERTGAPVARLYQEHVKALLQNSLTGSGVVEAEAIAQIESFIDRVQTLADDMVAIMIATDVQEASNL